MLSCAQIKDHCKFISITALSASLNNAKAKEKNGAVPDLWLPNKPHRWSFELPTFLKRLQHQARTVICIWPAQQPWGGGKKVAEGMCSAQGNRSLLRGLVFIAPDRPIPKLEEARGSRSYRAPCICSSRTFRVPKGRFSAGLAKYKINHDIYRRRKRVSRLT